MGRRATRRKRRMPKLPKFALEKPTIYEALKNLKAKDIAQILARTHGLLSKLPPEYLPYIEEIFYKTKLALKTKDLVNKIFGRQNISHIKNITLIKSKDDKLEFEVESIEDALALILYGICFNYTIKIERDPNYVLPEKISDEKVEEE